jgi:Ring finger domain
MPLQNNKTSNMLHPQQGQRSHNHRRRRRHNSNAMSALTTTSEFLKIFMLLLLLLWSSSMLMAVQASILVGIGNGNFIEYGSRPSPASRRFANISAGTARYATNLYGWDMLFSLVPDNSTSDANRSTPSCTWALKDTNGTLFLDGMQQNQSAPAVAVLVNQYQCNDNSGRATHFLNEASNFLRPVDFLVLYQKSPTDQYSDAHRIPKLVTESSYDYGIVTVASGAADELSFLPGGTPIVIDASYPALGQNGNASMAYYVFIYLSGALILLVMVCCFFRHDFRGTPRVPLVAPGVPRPQEPAVTLSNEQMDQLIATCRSVSTIRDHDGVAALREENEEDEEGGDEEDGGQRKNKSSSSHIESCPICIEDCGLDRPILTLPCQHTFHTACILPWLTQKKAECPMCKDDVLQRVLIAVNRTNEDSNTAAESALSASSGASQCNEGSHEHEPSAV